MKKSLFFWLIWVTTIISLILGACAAPPAEEPAEEPASTEIPPELDATNLGEEFSPGRIVFASDLLMLTPDLIAQMEPAYDDSDTITAAELDATGGDIKFIQMDASMFQVGQIISTGVSDETPYGLLRKVVDVNQVGSEVLVTTEQAKLEDAIEEGEFSVTYSQFSSSLDSVASSLGGGALMKAAPKPIAAPIEIDLIDEVLYNDGQGGQVTANGRIYITPDFFFHVDVSGATIQELTFENRTVIDANIEVFSGVKYEIHENIEIYKKLLPPIAVPEMPFVVITPKIVVSVGLDGQVSSGVTLGARYKNNASVKVAWANNNWDITQNGNATSTYIAPEFKATLSARVYARPRLELLLWGVAGPYAHIDGYYKFIASPQNNPWWTLDLGIDAVIGVSIKIFKFVELNPLHKEFPLYHKTIAHAPEELEPAAEPPPEPAEPPPPEPAEPPPPEPAEPPPPSGNENILIEYDNTSAFVINTTQDPVRIKGLEFNRIDNQGNVTASYQADFWGNFYSGYDLVQPGYCLRIASPNSSTNPGCTVQVNYETSQDRYHFWRQTSTSSQFEVLQNGTLLQTCEISDGACNVYVP
jgi:hypothetical protein